MSLCILFLTLLVQKMNQISSQRKSWTFRHLIHFSHENLKILIFHHYMCMMCFNEYLSVSNHYMEIILFNSRESNFLYSLLPLMVIVFEVYFIKLICSIYIARCWCNLMKEQLLCMYLRMTFVNIRTVAMYM